MISIKVSTKGGLQGLSDPRVSLRDDGFLSPGQERMQDLGEFALKVLRVRVSRGIGSDDSAMPALKVHPRAGTKFKIHGQERQLLGYAQWKSNHGLQPIRDLKGTGKDGGNMLDNLTVRSVSGSSVTMSLTARKARAKALANERLSPWLGWSGNDTREIVKFFATYTGYIVEAVAYKLRRAWRKAA